MPSLHAQDLKEFFVEDYPGWSARCGEFMLGLSVFAEAPSPNKQLIIILTGLAMYLTPGEAPYSREQTIPLDDRIE